VVVRFQTGFEIICKPDVSLIRVRNAAQHAYVKHFCSMPYYILQIICSKLARASVFAPLSYAGQVAGQDEGHSKRLFLTKGALNGGGGSRTHLFQVITGAYK